jgi:isoleucyl-tRNA synthetase
VHLCDFPLADVAAIDEDLSARMALVREIVSQGRAARTQAKLRVRQPLAKVEVILADRAHQSWLEEHSDLIAEELNVKQVEFTRDAEHYISYSVLPDLKRLGPRLGKQLPALKAALAEVDAGNLLAEMETFGTATIKLPREKVTLDRDDLQVRLQAKPGWAAAQGKSCVVVLATELSDELVAEGWARELVHVVQAQRKELDCQYTDRIQLAVVTSDAVVQSALGRFADYICGETLATELTFAPIADATAVETKLGDIPLQLFVRIVK